MCVKFVCRAAVVTLLMFIGNSTTAEEFRLSITLEDIPAEQKKAWIPTIHNFINSCNRDWRNVTDPMLGPIAVPKEPLTEGYGWTHAARFTARSEGADVEIILGAGKSSGLLIKDEKAAAFCGMTIPKGAVVFLPVADLDVLADLMKEPEPPKPQPTGFVTKGGYPACVTEDAFKEAISALIERDAAWFEQIPGCIITKEGIKMTIVDRGFARSKVRLHPPGGQRPIVMWTNSENIVSK